MQKRTGFTLLELLVVIVIASILAIMGFSGYMENLRDSRRQDAILSLQKKYFAINNNETVNCPEGTSTPCLSNNEIYNIYYSPTGFAKTGLATSDAQLVSLEELLILKATPAAGKGQDKDITQCQVIYLSDQNKYYPSICEKK